MLPDSPGEISASHVFRIAWRGWTVGVTTVLMVGCLIALPMQLFFGEKGSFVQALLAFIFLPFFAALQGLIVAAIVSLGFMVSPPSFKEKFSNN